ncbi:MAG: myo-inosose-2 dehydratase [Geminicoccaceae bacterium]
MAHGPIKLGIAPIAWSNDDLPELGGETTLETCLSEAKAAGFSGVEKGGKFHNDPKVLGPIMAAHGVVLCSGWFSGALRHGTLDDEKRRIAEQLHLFQALDVPLMIYAETTGTVQGQIDTPVADRPVMPDDEFGSYGEKLTAFADWLKAEGCPMSYHHHMGTVIETEREVDRLMGATGASVGLLLDTGHLTFAGGDVLATTRRHGDRINHVHCKDIRGEVLARLKAGNWSFLKGVLEGVFTVPGDGMIDYGPFAELLAEIGYQGWAVVEAEQDPLKADPFEMAKVGHAALSQAFGDAGFVIEA